MKDSRIVEFEDKMKKTLENMQQSFSRLRSGKASISMLDGIRVSLYGDTVPLNQVANLKTPDPKLILIMPWDKEAIAPIIKAIQKANIGLNPVQDGNSIKLPIPPLTEEIRRTIVKDAHKLAEEARVALRNIRRDANNEFKRLKKDSNLSEDDEKRLIKDIQDIHDNLMRDIDNHLTSKEKQIMEV